MKRPPIHRPTTPLPLIRRRRAVALIVALSVLVILTIIIMGLAASAGVERDLAARAHARADATQLARLAVESAMTLLRKNQAATLDPRITETPEGRIIRDLRATKGDEPFYGGPYLRRRPGDGLLTVYVSVAQGGNYLVLRHRYLLNATPSGERRLRVDSLTTSFENDFSDVNAVIERLGQELATPPSPQAEPPDA